MANQILLLLRERDGEPVIEGVDTRTVHPSGGSLAMTFPKDLMKILGFWEDGTASGGEIELRYSLDPRTDELVVEGRMEIPADDWLEELGGPQLSGLTDAESNGDLEPDRGSQDVSPPKLRSD